MALVLGIPPAVLQLNQQGLLERAFHDGLFPALQYRAEAMPEEWPANTGTEIFMTRPGLMSPVTTPLVPGADPLPNTVPFEQWSATLSRWSNSIDVHMPTSATANANLFLRDIHQLGLNAGQSINRVARNAMFQAYVSGQTVSIAAIAAIDTSIRVAALNGFTDVISNVRPTPVSPASPLPIVIGPGAGTAANVVGFIPDDPTDPLGPGTLILAAAVGAAFAVRAPVRSRFAPQVVRAAGGDSVDAIGPADTFTLQQLINGVGILRQNNVQPHEDGFYHAHISPQANSQVFADPVFQRLNQSLPEHHIYKEAFIGTIANAMCFMNNESPTVFNTSTTTPTALSGLYDRNIGGEVTNGAGTNIGRVILTGKGLAYEKYLDEQAYVTEAGITGKVGEFDVVNNGINILTERIRLILRAPLNRLQDTVAATWSISTSFPIPSDFLAPGGNARYRRAVVLEHAI